MRLVLLFRSGLEKWVIFENPEREREPRKSVSREQRLRHEQESISWEGGAVTS